MVPPPPLAAFAFIELSCRVLSCLGVVLGGYQFTCALPCHRAIDKYVVSAVIDYFQEPKNMKPGALDK